MLKSRHIRSGFTIVELLIVIVVIGILAAITIVSFNGVTGRAKVAAAQTDLENSTKQFEAAKATSGTTAYPTAIDCSAIPAANTICLKPTNGATFTYYVNNTASPPAYCLTTTNGSTVYYTSSSKPTPTTGACPIITNLAVNPSFEVAGNGLTGWGGYNGYNATASYTRMTDGGGVGNAYQRMQWTVATPDGVAGAYAYSNVATAGQVYTVSAYVRSNKTRNIQVGAEWYDGSNNSLGKSVSDSTNSGIPIPANTWTRISFTSTAAPANTAKLTATFYGVSSSAPFAVGDTFDSDGLMVTNGPTLYSYADGDSPNGWVWNGTNGNSTSNGVGL